MVRKNRPFHPIENVKHALNGLSEVYQSEAAFRIELLFFVLLCFVLILLPMGFVHKAILFFSLFLPLLAELINSAVERAVDLVTNEFHQMAKKAKDAASAVVLVSIVITVLIWAATFYHAFLTREPHDIF